MDDNQQPPTLRELSSFSGLTIRSDRAPQASDDTPTDRLGRYPITGQLGAGGMGEVLQVRDEDVGREMAAKVIRGEANPQALAKFIREGQITGQLEHPNIIPMHELGITPDQQVYFTMKRVDGEDLSALIAAERKAEGSILAGHTAGPRPSGRRLAGDLATIRRRSLNKFLDIFLKICDAMSFAHSRDVIHRDLKPANVMVGRFGEVQLMDWGLAKVLDCPDPAADDGCTLELSEQGGALKTLDGSVVGTPAYMPPEQARGEIDRLDRRADVYALGAMLYEMLTLEAPYEGDSVWDVLNQVKSGTPIPPSRRTPEREIPWELDATVTRAMAATPKARYDTVAQLKADIEAYLEGRVLSAADYTTWQVMRKWAGRNKALSASLAVGLAALIAGVLGVMAYQRTQTRQRVETLVALSASQLRAGQSEQAETSATRAMELDPSHAGALVLLRKSAVAADAARKRKALAHRISVLELRLKREDAAARTKAETPQAWYAARTKLLGTGMELARLAPGRSHAVAIRTALALAHQLQRDASWEMSRLMIRQAAELGLGETQRAQELAQLARRRTARRRREIAVVRKVLASLGSGLPRAGMFSQHVLDVARLAEPHVVKLLIPTLFSGTEWQRRLAISALGKMGIRRITAPVPPELFPVKLPLHRNPDVQSGMQNLYRRFLANARRADRVLLLDPVDALSIRLLQIRIDTGLEEAVELTWALGRLKDARAFLVVEGKRWGSQRASIFWQRTRLPFSWLPLPTTSASDLKGPEAWLHHQRLAHYHFRTGDLVRALAEYTRAIGLSPRQTLLYVQRGQLHYQAQRYSQALADYEMALALDANSVLALDARGNARRQLGQHKGAIADATRAIEIRPNAFYLYNNRAMSYSASGDVARAIADYSRAIQLNPDVELIYVNRARSYKSKQQFGKALADLAQAIRIDPRGVEAYIVRALLHWKRGHQAKALADCERAVLLDPSDTRTYMLRGQVYLAQGHPKKALVEYDHAISLRPKDYNLLLIRGQTRVFVKNYKGALSDLDRCEALMPKNDPMRQRLMQLRLATKFMAGQPK